MTGPSLIQVFVFRGGEYVGDEIFTEPKLLIGRGRQVDLSLEDEAVAEAHAVLSHENGQASLLKLGGSLVLVNHVAVEHTAITARDEIQIGSHTLKIKFLTSKGGRLSSRPAEGPAIEMPAGLPNEAKADARTERYQPGKQNFDLGSALFDDVSLSGAKPVVEEPLTAADALGVDGMGAEASGADPVWSEAEAPRAGIDIQRVPQGHLEMALEAAFSGDLIDSHAGLELEPGLVTAPREASQDLTLRPNFDLRAGSPQNRPPAPIDILPSRRTGDLLARPTTQDLSGKSADLPVKRSQDLLKASVDLPFRRSQDLPKASVDLPSKRSQDLLKASVDLPSKRGQDLPKGRPPGAMPPPDVAEEHDPGEDPEEAEDHREATERPGFSLAQALLEVDAPPKGAKLEANLALEVLVFASDGVRTSALLKKKGARFVLGQQRRGRIIPSAGHPGLKLARVTREGRAILQFPITARGAIKGGAHHGDLEELKRPEHSAGRRGFFQVQIEAGQTAEIRFEELAFHFRFVRPPAVALEARSFKLDREIFRSFSSSIVVHLLLALVVGLSIGHASYSEANREAWAEPKSDLRDVEIKPDPPPPPPPEPKPEPQPVAEVKAPEPPKTEPRPKKRAPPSGPKNVAPAPAAAPTAPPKTDVKAVGVLGALGKLNLAAPGKRSVSAAVSNIDAVKAPGSSNFRLGGLIGKLPASSVSVGGGGGGAPLTRGGAELLRGDGLAQLGKRASGTVRGQVTKVTASHVEAKGSISRDEIAAVMNEHLKDVQYCYERTLLKDPGMTGKLVLEWTINIDGSVGRVKEKLSTLRNPGVSSCISAALQHWKFPKPRGGVVIVSYPFVFNAVGF